MVTKCLLDIGMKGDRNMPMFKKSLIILLVMAVAAAGGAMYGFLTRDEALVLDAGSTKTQSSDALPQAGVTVYVTGAVNRPGVVTLAEGKRVLDAVNACGGMLPTADASRVNMAQVLKDGQRIQVPEKEQISQDSAGKGGNGGNSVKDNKLVNINTADVQALDSLPGVGPATAQKIIDYRTTEGEFQSIEDLKKVKGIGEAKFSKLKDKICV